MRSQINRTNRTAKHTVAIVHRSTNVIMGKYDSVQAAKTAMKGTGDGQRVLGGKGFAIKSIIKDFYGEFALTGEELT